MAETSLKRNITYRKLLFYGLGTMVGGGFYALIGKVAGEAAMLAPIAFLVAGLLALVNGFTYGELSSRYPVSAGEAQYVHEAFGARWFSTFVGLLVVITGVVSAATLSVASIGFLQDLIAVPTQWGIAAIVLIMGALCAWGVGESVWAVVGITVVEIAALFFVVFVTGDSLGEISRITSEVPALFSDATIIVGIMSGAFLGFYAFVGFEDMANMAEEVVDARRTLPKAILGSVILTTALYVIVSSTCILTVAPQELAESTTPLALVVADAGNSAQLFLIIVSIFTGVNGALVQIIMASRVLYGLGKQTGFLSVFSRVHSRTQTPIEATGFVTMIVLALALFFPLVGLAQATSAIILIVFAMLNLALIVIKRRKTPVPEGARTFHVIVPVIGFVVCVGVLLFKLWDTAG